MTSPELAAAFGGGLIGVALGARLMAWHWLRSERAGDAKPEQMLRVEQLELALRNQTAAIDKLEAQHISLTASLDDAHREISCLTGEKHARDTVIHEIVETATRLHRQEAGK